MNPYRLSMYPDEIGSVHLLIFVVNGVDNKGTEYSLDKDSSSCECWNREGMQQRILESVGNDECREWRSEILNVAVSRSSPKSWMGCCIFDLLKSQIVG